LTAPKEIIDLVDRFENKWEAYKSRHYNETQVRREFIDHFFKALGCDIDKEQRFAKAYKDVIHEDAIKVGGTTRAPDYSFRIGGQRKFFLETKKPSVDIKDDIHPAFQIRRYAWAMLSDSPSRTTCERGDDALQSGGDAYRGGPASGGGLEYRDELSGLRDQLQPLLLQICTPNPLEETEMEIIILEMMTAEILNE